MKSYLAVLLIALVGAKHHKHSHHQQGFVQNKINKHVSGRGSFGSGNGLSYVGPEDPDEAVHHIMSLKEDSDEASY